MTAAIVAWVQISSSHQDPAAPPPRGNERGATSALTGVFWGAELSLAKKRLFFCHLQLFWHIHTTQLSRKLAGRPQSIEF